MFPSKVFVITGVADSPSCVLGVCQAGMTVDPFATICLGNIAYKQSSCDDDREWERQMRVAFNHFKTVMKVLAACAFSPSHF